MKICDTIFTDQFNFSVSGGGFETLENLSLNKSSFKTVHYLSLNFIVLLDLKKPKGRSFSTLPLHIIWKNY